MGPWDCVTEAFIRVPRKIILNGSCNVTENSTWNNPNLHLRETIVIKRHELARFANRLSGHHWRCACRHRLHPKPGSHEPSQRSAASSGTASGVFKCAARETAGGEFARATFL